MVFYMPLLQEIPADQISDLGLFNSSDPVHVDCIRFCFMSLLRSELYQVTELRNQHNISSSKSGNTSGPMGRPECMFFLPHMYSMDDFKVILDEDDVEEFIDQEEEIELKNLLKLSRMNLTFKSHRMFTILLNSMLNCFKRWKS